MRIIGFVGLCLFPFLLQAQDGFSPYVKNTEFEEKDNTIIVTYDLEGNSAFDVIAYYSIDNGKKYNQIRRDALKGDVGQNIRKGEGRQFTWDLLMNMPGFVGPLTIKIEARPSARSRMRRRKPLILTLSSQSYAQTTSIPELVNDLNPVSFRLGLGSRWGMRTSYLSSSNYQESYTTLGIAKSIFHSRNFSWNIYPLGGAIIESTSRPTPSFLDWVIGGGTDLILGPLTFNVDMVSTLDGQVRTSAGIGWAFRM